MNSIWAALFFGISAFGVARLNGLPVWSWRGYACVKFFLWIASGTYFFIEAIRQ